MFSITKHIPTYHFPFFEAFQILTIGELRSETET